MVKYWIVEVPLLTAEFGDLINKAYQCAHEADYKKFTEHHYG